MKEVEEDCVKEVEEDCVKEDLTEVAPGLSR